MSVAFRRDCDEDHLEPKFALPIPAGPNLVTARGLALIERQAAQFEAALSAAPDEPARETLKRDLHYWRARRASAQIAPQPSGDRVEFGTRVRLVLKERERSYWIVGDDEADPANGMLCFKAPLCRAMLGAEVGDILPFAGDEEAIAILGIDIPEDLPITGTD